MVYGVVNEEMKEILSRHIIGETLDLVDIDEIFRKFEKGLVYNRGSQVDGLIQNISHICEH